jgi:capsular exopolysaccharide synthesis family protein
LYPNRSSDHDPPADHADRRASIESIDLLGYWQILVRRRWVIYLAVSALGLVALVGSFLTTPLYRATTTLQIERQNPEILNFQDVARTDFAWAAYNDFYQTQYKIIASMPVARAAAERLNLTDHEDFAVGDGKPGLLARLKAMVPRKRGKSVKQAPLDVAAAQVLGSLEISPVRNSHLVRISWTHADPELAAMTANAMADAYIQFNIESRYSTTDQAREFLVNQIGTLKREISAMEVRLQEYGEAKNIFTVDDSSNLTLQALQSISEQRTVAQTEVARAQAVLRAALEANPESLPEVLNSTLIGRLRAEYAAYEAEYTEQAELFKDDWPGLQTLASKLEQARERLGLETRRIVDQVRATAEADYRRALQQAENLDRLLTDHERAAQRLKRDAVEFNNLQTEVRKKRETLDALLRRQNEMALSTRLRDLDSTSSNIRVMEQAQAPTAPFRPNTRLNLLLGLVLGLALGVAAALVLDHLDNTISSSVELEKILSLPVLGVIPRHGSGATPLARVRRQAPNTPAVDIDLIAHRDGRSGVSEAYRGLRTSILLSNPGQPPRLIVLTSALPEDGKTATALNLAVVLAQLGRRVVLIDTDLRRPRLHKAFGVENARGVSTFLSGLEDDPQKLVVSTGIDQLDVIPSGPIPPNPSELLNSAVFARLGPELLDRGYDHVLFDSPPVLSVSDPAIVASVADTGILVVRAGRTPRQSARLAAERLEQTGGGPFGVVLNDFDVESQGAGYERYQTYYGRYEPDEDETDVKPATRVGSRGA